MVGALKRIVELELKLREKEFEISHLRAHLMELRVAQEADRQGAVGWMVSAFVPDSAIKALRAKPEMIPDYVKLVAEALVSNAVQGIIRIDSRGKVSAMIFEHVTNPKQQVIRCRPIFETDNEHSAAVDLKEAKQLASESEHTRRMLTV